MVSDAMSGSNSWSHQASPAEFRESAELVWGTCRLRKSEICSYHRPYQPQVKMTMAVETKVSASLGILKRIEVDVTRIGDAITSAVAGKTIDSELVCL